MPISKDEKKEIQLSFTNAFDASVVCNIKVLKYFGTITSYSSKFVYLIFWTFYPKIYIRKN